MRVGDLLIDFRSRELGLLIAINPDPPQWRRAYLIMDVDGTTHWYERDYIEKDCEVISGSR